MRDMTSRRHDNTWDLQEKLHNLKIIEQSIEKSSSKNGEEKKKRKEKRAEGERT